LLSLFDLSALKINISVENYKKQMTAFAVICNKGIQFIIIEFYQIEIFKSRFKF